MAASGKINLGKIAFVEKGVYNVETTYERFHFVTTEDSTYLSLKDDNVGNPTTDAAAWLCLADGKPATEAALKAIEALNKAAVTDAKANAAIKTLNDFLSASGASDSIINTWKEIEEFLEGISDADTLEGMLLKQKQTITKERNTALEGYSRGGHIEFSATIKGWYRIASFPMWSAIGVCSLHNPFNNNRSEGVIFSFQAGYGDNQGNYNAYSSITQLGGSDVSVIDKARIIGSANGDQYLEVHYTGHIDGNSIRVNLSNAENPTMIAGTAGEIPDGYFAKEVAFHRQAVTSENIYINDKKVHINSINNTDALTTSNCNTPINNNSLVVHAMSRALNRPSSIDGVMVDYNWVGGSFRHQMYYSVDSNQIFSRHRREDGGYTLWTELYHTGNLSPSDKRLKDIIEEQIPWQEILEKVSPKIWEWKNQTEQECSTTGNKKKIGYISQEIEKYAAWMVGKNRYNGEFDNFDEAQMIPILHLAYLDTAGRVTKLEEQNEALIKRLEALEQK